MTRIEKYLGKIDLIEFGINDRDWIGLTIGFSTKAKFKDGPNDSYEYDFVPIKGGTFHNSFGTFTWLSAKSEHFIKDLERLMRKAKVSKIQDLVNKPVVLEIKDNVLNDWRILEEVL